MSPQCPVMSAAADNAGHFEHAHSHAHDHKPSPHEEFNRIQRAYPALASTGCTAKFCQSGRMKHTDEDRVGRNQPVESVERDAVDFLYQLRQGGIIKSEPALNKRIQEVLAEIRTNSTCARYKASTGNGSELTEALSVGTVGGNWTQSFEELEFGIRVAWKHARRCIMRSEYKDLKLCDLRHVETSIDMANELIEALKLAFNGGEIRPTARAYDKMLTQIFKWNSQLLAFAGYTEENGTILGDPQNVSLTKAFMELGWTPPAIRTKWDLLPLVTMAEGEEPVITEMPKDAFPLVHIQHPRYKLSFDKLGLRWVPAPALSKLGFTIGGVQYTASPFIGWFMDAEIGVRDLVDPFRYNVLPEVIRKMGLFNGDLDNLPDYERLALICELNYAVSWSYAKAGVRMIDSLGASELFSRFDDEHMAENGYRLPSDPYWLAPPQGSIIPLWHRGSSPNYQPRPMICHHVLDPVKTWRRETQQCPIDIPQATKLSIQLSLRPPVPKSTRRIFVSFCSSGTTAGKLSKKLHQLLSSEAANNPMLGFVMPVQTLNALQKTKLEPRDALVIIASNTRRGELPQNGRKFHEALKQGSLPISCRFSMFGNGSKDYPDTFNQAAKDLFDLLVKSGAVSMETPVLADTAAENPPWTMFNMFHGQLLQALIGSPQDKVSLVEQQQETKKQLLIPAESLLDTKPWFRADIRDVIHRSSKNGIKHVTLELGNRGYPTMANLSILPPNPESVVQSVLQHLNTNPDERLEFAGGITVEEFFRFYADLYLSFKSCKWAAEIASLWDVGCELEGLPIPQAIAKLPSNWRYWAKMEDLCRAVPRIQPRKYSIASDHGFKANSDAESSRLDLLVQHHVGGRFSDLCLGSVHVNSLLTCRIEPASHLERMASAIGCPLIILATGSGMAPIRCLLQHRARLLGSAATESTHAPISLFAGFKAEDEAVVQEAVENARSLNLFDVLKLTPSNPEKRRAQDRVFDDEVRKKLVEKIKGTALVFVCAKPEAEEGFLANLSAIVGRDVKDALGDRYLADIYQPAV